MGVLQQHPRYFSNGVVVVVVEMKDCVRSCVNSLSKPSFYIFLSCYEPSPLFTLLSLRVTFSPIFSRCATVGNHVLLWLHVRLGQLLCVYDLLPCMRLTGTRG